MLQRASSLMPVITSRGGSLSKPGEWNSGLDLCTWVICFCWGGNELLRGCRGSKKAAVRTSYQQLQLQGSREVGGDSLMMLCSVCVDYVRSSGTISFTFTLRRTRCMALTWWEQQRWLSVSSLLPGDCAVFTSSFFSNADFLLETTGLDCLDRIVLFCPHVTKPPFAVSGCLK